LMLLSAIRVSSSSPLLNALQTVEGIRQLKVKQHTDLSIEWFVKAEPSLKESLPLKLWRVCSDFI